MTLLAVTRTGHGAPLVLLHALGMSRAAWDPVVPLLAAHFDVVALDLPGFGDSVPLPGEPAPEALAAAVAATLDRLGIVAPHVAGNSLGGWVALELARLRPVASLTLLAPAGLWRRTTPLYCRVSLRATRWLAAHGSRVLSRAVDHRLGRVLVFGQTHGRPSRLSPAQARTAIHALGTGTGFAAALRASNSRRFAGDLPDGVAVTVAFGSRDLILLPHQSRHLERLPAGTRRVRLAGCGHIPMSDDPVAVAALIRDRAENPGTGRPTDRGRSIS